MIKIPVSKVQKEEIEKIYWDWICKYHLKSLLQVIREDRVMTKLILNDDENLQDALRKFLLSDYNELEYITERIAGIRKGKRYRKIKIKTKLSLLNKYKNYRNTQAAKIINILGISVCPYCNQNHINIVYQKNKMKFWGDLDHFYNKNEYPELALCLYNMIPVCKVCNQLKSSKKAKIINPYNCSIESGIKFETAFDEKMDLKYLQGKSQNFNIVIEKNGASEKDLAEIELFDLENRYKQLKRNAQEIIIKSRAYDDLYRDELKTKFDLDDKEIEAYIFGYSHNHLSRVLSKFNLDIRNEFKGNVKEP